MTLYGPHYYRSETYVGNTADGITADSVFQALRSYAAPTLWPSPRSDGEWSWVTVPILGTVTHTVDPEGRVIINTTDSNHLLYPGAVFRQVVEREDGIYIVTEGYGDGMLPQANTSIAPFVFQLYDMLAALKANPVLWARIIDTALKETLPSSLYHWIRDPLVLDLDADGVEVSSPDHASGVSKSPMAVA